MTLLVLQAYRLFRNELEALMGRKPTKEEILIIAVCAFSH